MIYFYQPIPNNSVENLHSYLHFFFTNLFNEVYPTYEHSYYIQSEFQNIVDAYEVHFDEKLERIFNAYNALANPEEKTLVQRIYFDNNNIEGICNMTVIPHKYSALPDGIRDAVESLYDKLWDPLLASGNYATVRNDCGTVKNHFDAFRKVNTKSVCPFCGMEGLLCETDDGRDDYDHYLPKADYPFIAVNFLNLFPMCHNCNSKNKGQCDTPFITDTTTQRLLYFPYDTTIHNHMIILTINSPDNDLSNPEAWKLNITCEPIGNDAKKNAWMSIFNIETRYKSRIAKRYKEVWMARVQKRYLEKSKNKTVDIDMIDFRKEFTYSYEEIMGTECYILANSYHDFIFNDPNFENNLKGVI